MSSASTTPKSSKRPRSIAELATAAQVYPWDPTKSLKEILITTSALKKSGDKYRDEGDLESAFVDYARAATIVLERIPQHVSYPDLSSVHRHNLSLVSVLTGRLFDPLTLLCRMETTSWTGSDS